MDTENKKEREPANPSQFEKIEDEVFEGEVIDDEYIEDNPLDDDIDMPSDEEIEEVLAIVVSTGLASFGGLLAMKFGDDMKLTDDENAKLTHVWTATVKNSPNWLMQKISSSPLGMASIMTLGVFGSKFARRSKASDEIQKET